MGENQAIRDGLAAGKDIEIIRPPWPLFVALTVVVVACIAGLTWGAVNYQNTERDTAVAEAEACRG